MNRAMNISSIETYLYERFKGVSAHTYVGMLPETIRSDWNDMLLIDCDNGVTDLDAYGTGTVLLFAYARPRSDGKKNVALLSQMEDAIDAVIEGHDSSGSYHIYRKKTYSDYDYSRNWHCNITALGITVK